MILIANVFTFIAFLLSSFCTKLWQVSLSPAEQPSSSLF